MPCYISQMPFKSDYKIFVLFVYQIVVGNGEETVTANFNVVITAYNQRWETKCKY